MSQISRKGSFATPQPYKVREFRLKIMTIPDERIPKLNLNNSFKLDKFGEEDNLYQTLRRNSCPCESCGSQPKKLIGKLQVSQPANIIRSKVIAEARERFKMLVKSVIRINNIKSRGMTLFKKRLAHFTDRKKSVPTLMQKQIQFLENHYNVNARKKMTMIASKNNSLGKISIEDVSPKKKELMKIVVPPPVQNFNHLKPYIPRIMINSQLAQLIQKQKLPTIKETRTNTFSNLSTASRKSFMQIKQYVSFAK